MLLRLDCSSIEQSAAIDIVRPCRKPSKMKTNMGRCILVTSQRLDTHVLRGREFGGELVVICKRIKKAAFNTLLSISLS